VTKIQDTPALRGRDIICLSTHYWDERRFRKQEFMSRFADANRVLFVEPSFSIARRPEAHLEKVASNRILRAKVEPRKSGLHILKPPRGFPKWTDPRVERLSYRRYGRIIARATARLGFRDAILWLYHPSYVYALDAIPHRQLVFDLVDDLTAYQGDRTCRAHVVEGQVKAVVERSDLLVVTAGTLLERYRPLARRIARIPNGFDAQKFSPGAGGAAVPPALEHVPRPILGFVGTIFTLLDFDLLSATARAHPDKSLVLVGPVEATAEEALAGLTARPNVFHVGPQPQSSIPAFIAAFDVCLNPFAKGPVADSVSPLKVYEYLAMGRPVLSAPMKSLQMEEAGSAVAFGDGAEEFSRQIEVCLSDRVQAEGEARIAAVSSYSWDRLFDSLSAVCADALVL
jgi:glycosyltransferase involved in cell wall biosynthesis